jgi:hypothetical protein
VNGLVLAATSVLEIEIDPTNSQGNGINDLIQVSGAVDLGLAELMIDLLSAPTLGEGFDILLNDGDDPVVGGRPGPIYADFGGLTYRFDVNYAANADGGTLGNDLRVTVSAVPVPGVLWLMGLGCLGLAGWAGRKQTPSTVNG